MLTSDLYDIVQPFDGLQSLPERPLQLRRRAPRARQRRDRRRRALPPAGAPPNDRFVAHYGLGERNGAPARPARHPDDQHRQLRRLPRGPPARPPRRHVAAEDDPLDDACSSATGPWTSRHRRHRHRRARRARHARTSDDLLALRARRPHGHRLHERRGSGLHDARAQARPRGDRADRAAAVRQRHRHRLRLDRPHHRRPA